MIQRDKLAWERWRINTKTMLSEAKKLLAKIVLPVNKEGCTSKNSS